MRGREGGEGGGREEREGGEGGGREEREGGEGGGKGRGGRILYLGNNRWGHEPGTLVHNGNALTLWPQPTIELKHS